MKKLFVFMLVLGITSVSGCAWVQKQFYHLGSAAIGLSRVVTLYAADGRIIRQWSGRIMVEVDGSSASWIENGKETKISGTFIVEQK